MEFYKLRSVNSINDLKSLGRSIDEINKIINGEINPIHVNALTWEELYSVIVKLKEHWDTLQYNKYFKNENARYIYALVHMDTSSRNKVIGLKNDLYDDAIKAKKWYLKISNKIHPDHNLDNKEDAEKAFKELTSIYERIKWAAQESK